MKHGVPPKDGKQSGQSTGMRPEFLEKIKAFEALFNVDFTAKEEEAIQEADAPRAMAEKIARQNHHADFMSRNGGKFAPGRAGSAYYKQKGEK